MLVLMFLSSLVDLHDLSKFSMLINHYREHVASGEISPREFIDLHYGEQAKEHDKQHGHRSLPFKSHESASTHHLTAFLDLRILPESEEIPAPTQQESLYTSHFTPGFSKSIFQPPRQ
jgi:hypothetical protein